MTTLKEIAYSIPSAAFYFIVAHGSNSGNLVWLIWSNDLFSVRYVYWYIFSKIGVFSVLILLFCFPFRCSRDWTFPLQVDWVILVLVFTPSFFIFIITNTLFHTIPSIQCHLPNLFLTNYIFPYMLCFVNFFPSYLFQSLTLF